MALEKKYPPIIIESERVILKKKTPEMADALYALIEQSRDSLTPFLYWMDNTNGVNDVRKYSGGTLVKWDSFTNFVYLIFSKETNELMGSIDLQEIDWDNYGTKIGYWMGASFQGHGFMVEAVNALTEAAFEIGFQRVEIRCRPDNERSQSVARRSGYTQEGLLRKVEYAREQFYDDMVFSRLCDDD